MMTTRSPQQLNSLMNEDPISDALNMTPIQELLPAEKKKPPVADLTDFDYARGNMLNILEKGNEALDGILDVAQQSQHPRAFEVVAGLIKTLSDTNKDLLELQKRQKDIIKQDEADSGPKTVNNNLFVGSTTELQKLLKQQHEQK
jgi:hypothetical protein